MPVSNTSLTAYDHIKETLSAKRKAVLEVLQKENRPMTNKEISVKLGWEINRITGRVNELVELQLVRKVRRGTCPVTGFGATFWGWVPIETQLEFDLHSEEIMSND